MYPGTHAKTKPDHPAYIMAATSQVVTYQELDEGSNRLAHLLRDAGLKRGDHIALMIENHPLFLQITWAAQRSGLYYTAISTRLSAEGAAYIINDCEARVFITSDALREMAADILTLTPEIKLRLMLDSSSDGYENYQQAVASCPTGKIDDEAEGLDMVYSSGTNGQPKGVL
ncbi:MAG: AMP-binding protein, partial [Acidimicrobiales bacterium]